MSGVRDLIAQLEVPPGPPPVTVVTRLQALPFRDLRWDDFERLCLRLCLLDHEVKDARRYGTPGQSQYGIDLFARRAGESGYTVYQCKKVDRFAASDISKAVSKFLAGPWAGQADEFVLCTSHSLADTRLADRLNAENKRLACRGVTLLVWDADVLAGMLKDHPELVDDFFGRAAVTAFCGPEAAAGLRQRRDGGERAGVPAGRLLAEVTDPFALEVHRPVQADDPVPGLPVLPAYVAREHDRRLAEAVRAAAEGSSGIAVLVGGSSTGKTRACWEALGLLRDLPVPWRLWHPIDPSRPEATLRELPSIGPRTVIWLNEAHFYLGVAAGGLGERVAAGLRELLRDPARAPVLVLATLWPQFWDELTARPAEDEDAHAQARELLAGLDITVPSAFTVAEMRRLAEAADPRLALAAEGAENGQVIQFLAGAPELMARYRNAPPAPSALIAAAMDARRLGMGIALPLAFLEQTAPSYLTDSQWDGLGEDWLEQALAYTAAPCKGVRGPLARIRSRPADGAGPADGPAYRLADYLDQHGRRARPIPPAGFWNAAAHYAGPDDLPALASAAEDRGLLREAARLRKRATAYGNATEAALLVRNWHHPYAADPRPAQWAAAHAPLGDLRGVVFVLHELREAGADRQVTDLADRAAAHAPLDDAGGVGHLLNLMRKAGADQQISALLARDPAAHVSLDDPVGVAFLLDALREAGADQQVTALLARDPAARVSLDRSGSFIRLLKALRAVGAGQQVTALAARAAEHITLGDLGVATRLYDLRAVGADQFATALVHAAEHASIDDLFDFVYVMDVEREVCADQQLTALAASAAAQVALKNPSELAGLLSELREVGADQLATALLARDPASHVALDAPGGVAHLLDALLKAGAGQQVTVLLARDPASQVAPVEPVGVAGLLETLHRAGADEQVIALAARAAANVSVDEPSKVRHLLDQMRGAGADQEFAALAARAAQHMVLDHAYGVWSVLAALRAAGADQQVTELLARDPAAHVRADQPRGVARLLRTLREAGADQQVTELAARAAAQVALDDPLVADLLDSMRAVGAGQQARTLVNRLPAGGGFEVFLKQPGHSRRFRYGRKLDGSPAPSWGWDDLE